MPTLACVSCLLSLVILLGLGPATDEQQVPLPRTLEDPSVRRVAGPSWLSERGVSLSRLMPDRVTPDAANRRTTAPVEPLGAVPSLVLDGAALYRLNCLTCHRDEHLGSPAHPAALETVEGPSLTILRQRLQKKAVRANLAVHLRKGTALMPPRTHLNKNDVDQLIAYLTQAIGKPVDAPRAQRVSSWARLGEHVVKGTCHICHDAVGRTPGRPGLPETDIPSLESLLARKSVAEFVRKARGDVTVAAREPGLFQHGRMPGFDYLRDEEVAAAYLYLATYPPVAGQRR